MKKLTSWILILAIPAIQGCATSYGRQNDLVRVYFRAGVAQTHLPAGEAGSRNVNSKTNAAQATVNCGGEATELPGNISLRRGSNHDCLAQAPGFEKLNFRVWSKISGEGFKYSTKVNWQKWSKWTLGIGNLVAWPVDFLSGSMKTLENDHYDLRMYPSSTTSSASRVWDKTSSVTQKIASIPADLVEETTSAVLTGVVKAPAEALGLASSDQRKDAEKVMEGHAAAEHFGTNSSGV